MSTTPPPEGGLPPLPPQSEAVVSFPVATVQQPPTKSPHTPVLALIAVVIFVLLCSTVLAATGHTAPGWFESAALIALGAAGGVAVPNRG